MPPTTRRSKSEAPEGDLPDQVPPATAEEFADTVDRDAIETVLSGLGETGGTVRISRKGPLDHTFQYLTKLPISQFDIEQIRRVYGGGDYQAKTFRANGQMYKPFEFSIDYRYKGALDEEQIKKVAEAPVAQVAPGSSPVEIMGMIERMMPKQQPVKDDSPMMMKMFELMQSKSDQTLMLIMAMMTESQKSMSSMMTAIMGTKQQPTDTITPVLLEMIKANGAASRPAGSLSETLETMMLMKEFMADGKADESLFERIAKYAGPIVQGAMPAVATLIASRNQARSPMQAQPVQDDPAPSPAEHREALAPVSVHPEQHAVMLNLLLAGARRNSDPVSYRDVVLDMLSEQDITALHFVLTQEGWRAQVFGENEEVEAHAKWFEELRISILEALNDDQDPADPPVHLSGGQVEGSSDLAPDDAGAGSLEAQP